MTRFFPSVSLVLPARNAETTIATAIESILHQTLSDWEMIIVDDGSTDDTPAILHHYAAREERIRVSGASGTGLVAALNQGARAARSALIARMDADDVSSPSRLGVQREFLRGHPDVGLVSCLVEFGGRRREAAGYAIHVDWLNTLQTPEEIALNRMVESPLAHPSVMFRKSLLAQYGGYRDGPFPEDYELWLRWLHEGVRMSKVKQTLITWNDPPDRLSRTDPRYGAPAFYRLKAEYLAKELSRSQKGRQLWIWGAGYTTRKRAELLCKHGLRIVGYIDVDPAKAGTTIGNRPVVPVEAIPPSTDVMVISYVANRGARGLVRSHLQDRGFAEGVDFWMAA